MGVLFHPIKGQEEQAVKDLMPSEFVDKLWFHADFGKLLSIKCTEAENR